MIRALLLAFALVSQAWAQPFVVGPALYSSGSSGITNPCTQVATCVAWLDASSASGVTLSGSTVTQWLYQGGGGSFITPSGSPQYSTNVQNGLNAIAFDGVNDTFNSGATSFLRNVAGWTVFAVVKAGQNTANQNVLSVHGASNATRVLLGSVVTTGYWRTGGRRLDADTFVSVDSTTQASLTTPKILTAIGDFTNTDAFLRLNGTQIASNTSWLTSGNSPNTDGVLNIGDNGAGTAFFTGWIGEIIIYSSALSSTDISSVETYLLNKWGL